MKLLSPYPKCRIGTIYEILSDLIKQSHVYFNEKEKPEKITKKSY